MDFLIEKVFDAVLEASGLKEKVGRSERLIRLKQRFGIADIESLTKFEDVYAYALVEYAFDAEGLCKHRALVEFFKLKAVRDVFRVAYRDNSPLEWLGKGQAIAQYELGGKLPAQIDPKRELGVFAAVFLKVVKGTRSPKENLQAQALEKLRGEVGRSLQAIQTQLQQLPTLEAINQQVNQLSGVPPAAQTLALPPAAQSSNAAELAHRLGEWFEVLEYDRDPDYEVWTQDYFEWAIDFPVTRRRMSRTLVRGIAGECEMGDLQAFAQAVAAANADEGWLVANRRVSRAVRNAVQTEDAYDAISCYTFDELLDEDADFSKYLDWLETEITTKGVDAGYLPLACRKDELDAASGRKIGVSTYAEEDGWIEGYVDMWLDDPAKEHLSILGEFGTGKTWFALHYAWVALQRYRQAKQRGTERPRIPVVVPLRDYAKAVSVESLFSEFFFRKHEILKNYSVFEQLNRMGKLLLIFDGFDEMAARVDRQAMIDNFWELAKVVVPGAKAILTCRTEHFPDAIEGRRLLNAELKASTADRTGEPPQFEVLELEKFSDAQIGELLSRKAKEETVQQVVGNAQLLDLARRPVMVDLILEALPDIEAGKPVDMARVYLYAVTRKMEKDLKSERTFTSMADKLYFLCELSWEMLSTNRMSLNYRDFPDRLEQMFADRVKEEKELDHWRYDMMGQTMLIRNSEGDYSPAHRSLLEFFVAYKIVASLGAMAVDFTAVAQKQLHVDKTLPVYDYTWDSYFKRECASDGEPLPMAQLGQFVGLTFDELLPILRQAKLSKAVLDLAHPMLDEATMREQLLPLLQATADRTLKESSYLGGNVAQLMLKKTPYALTEADLKGTRLRGVDFTKAFLRRTNLEGAQLAEITFSKALSYVGAVAYSPDSRYLAIGDSKGILQVWEIATGKVILFCTGHKAAIESVAYHPSGQQLASASDDTMVKLWNLNSGECIRTLQGHGSWVTSVAFSPDGQQLASGSNDTMVKLWSPSSGECIRTLQGHESWVRAVAFSPDGQQIASASDDTTVKLWNPTSGECICTLKSHKNRVISMAFSPDGQQIASGSDDSIVKLWNPLLDEEIYTLEGHENWARSVAFSPNGQQLVSGNEDTMVKLWNPSSGKCICTLQGHKSWVMSVAFSPDGQQLASGSEDNTVKLWNILSGECIRTLKDHEKEVMSVAFSPDGQQLASGSEDNTVKLWNILSGECIRTLQGHENRIRSVAFSPDGQQLASASDDTTVKLWDIVSGGCVRTLKGHTYVVRSVAFSPDGQQIVSGGDDTTVKLWNIDSGSCVSTLKGHRNWVRSVAFSPNGYQLASGSNDTTVKLWDIVSGNCVETLKGHRNAVMSLTFNSNGQQLASSSSDNTIRIWDVDTDECLCVIDERVCLGLNITNTVGLTPGQRTALKLMGAIDHNDE